MANSRRLVCPCAATRTPKRDRICLSTCLRWEANGDKSEFKKSGTIERDETSGKQREWTREREAECASRLATEPNGH